MEDLEVTLLRPATIEALLALLRAIERAGEVQWFQPHAFTAEHLSTLCDPDKRDLHYVLGNSSSVFGYGLLRGWDEGFEIPSLGIAIHPDYRDLGFGTVLMNFLHCAARLRGSERVRLRVNAANAAAISLYSRVGYRFEDSAEDSATGRILVAYKELHRE